MSEKGGFFGAVKRIARGESVSRRDFMTAASDAAKGAAAIALLGASSQIPDAIRKPELPLSTFPEVAAHVENGKVVPHTVTTSNRHAELVMPDGSPITRPQTLAEAGNTPRVEVASWIPHRRAEASNNSIESRPPNEAEIMSFNARVRSLRSSRSAQGRSETAMSHEEMVQSWIDQTAQTFVQECKDTAHFPGLPAESIRDNNFTPYILTFNDHQDGKAAAESGYYNTQFLQQLNDAHTFFNKFLGIKMSAGSNPQIIPMEQAFSTYGTTRTLLVKAGERVRALQGSLQTTSLSNQKNIPVYLYALNRDIPMSDVGKYISGYGISGFGSILLAPFIVGNNYYINIPGVWHEIGHSLLGGAHTNVNGDILNDAQLYTTPHLIAAEHKDACTSRVSLPLAFRKTP